MSVNETDAHSEEEALLSTEEILNRLVALGVNNSHRGYNQEQVALCEQFYSCELSTIARSWDLLEDGVKVKIVNKHSDEFKAWIGGK